MKSAFITGATGQDGSYLIELLLGKGYEVHGLVRRSSQFNRGRIDHIVDKNFKMYYGDVLDISSMYHVLKSVQPDEVYHLAAQSHVGISFTIPLYTKQVNADGTGNLLEAIRMADCNPRIYNACTSEIYGGSDGVLSEESEWNPRSPYAQSKIDAFYSMKTYALEYGYRVWNGILFNHESNRRGENFVTRKITLSIARILRGLQKEIVLGNLDAKRDWGYAPEYVEMMWRMLQSNKPDDFVVATGETHSVREFLEEAFSVAGQRFPVRCSELYLRPMDVECLCGDSSKAKRLLGWEPKVRFKELVRIMVEADINAV